ncbi:serine/threonine protein kinase [Methylobacterium sp. JK268]
MRLAALVLLGLVAAALPPSAGPRAQTAPAPGRESPAAEPRPAAPAPNVETTQAPAAAPRSEGRPAAGRVRRRISYAACNRAALRRSLRGGARRRFLIRCRLGYERIQPASPARPAERPPEGRPRP